MKTHHNAPTYAATFIGHPEDGGFYPDAHTGEPAEDQKGNPVIACHEEVIGLCHVSMLRAMFAVYTGGEELNVACYRQFLASHIAIDDALADDLVILEKFPLECQ